MSVLSKEGNEHHGQDNSRRYLLMGVAVSLLIHGGAIAAYWWQPSATMLPAAPAAAPMVVSLVMPLASPVDNQNELPPSEPQPQSTPEKPVATAESRQAEAKEAVRQAKAAARESVPVPVADKPSPFRKPVSPPTASVPEPNIAPDIAPDIKPDIKPKTEPQLVAEARPAEKVLSEQPVEPPPDKTSEATEPTAAAQQAAASAPTGVKAQEKAEVITAPMHGQLSKQGAQQKLTWQRLLHAHLEQHKKYPRQAKRFGRQGVPVIAFTMDRNGQVLAVKLVKSSGSGSLDEEAQALVRRAEPLPRPPFGIAGERLTFTVPISFRRSG
ncbi:TonB family protein [Photobacterium halotolerans]|uniref:energy transducer TonB n=1 Tax=Photobacterium halotolerans TaxID=265726 RepID=UPI001372D093|nr:energy transducer TonB [Photobacterium halotolerans]NAX48900.1 TonB family protein [Photobacterium halotolerans]